MITGMDKPFCAKHRRWPCAECGTSHYDGCQCSVCRPPVPFNKADPVGDYAMLAAKAKGGNANG